MVEQILSVFAAPVGSPGPQRRRWRRSLMLVFVFLLPVLLGAWQAGGKGIINSKYVSRIKNGQTTKHEIRLWFGDPLEVKRTPEGVVYTYRGFADAPQEVGPKGKEPNPQSFTPYFLDEDKKIRRADRKKEPTALKSTLIIRFTPDGEKVMSHEYQEKKQD